jgi:thiol-disulfide isomerase/thioredoxin
LNPPQRALAIALVVGMGLATGFLSYRLQSNRPLPPATGTPPSNVSPDADTLSAGASEPQPAAPHAVPSVLPDLQLPDLAGKSRSLRSFSGRPLIVNFWATWCAPCRREIPLLQELRQRHRAERLEIVGIAIDFGAAVQEFLRHTPIDYPLLVGEQQGLAAAEQFGVEPVLPFSVFVDAQGRIIAVKIGELHREEADFILGEITALDQGQTDLAQAREQIEGRLKELAVERAKAQQKGG